MAFDPNSTSFQEQNQQTNPVIATKSLACKLAKAAWHPLYVGNFFGLRSSYQSHNKHKPKQKKSPMKKKLNRILTSSGALCSVLTAIGVLDRKSTRLNSSHAN